MCFEYDFSALFIVAAYCPSNSMLQILHSETNFLETNFLNKLILQFLINNLYKHSSQGSRLSEKNVSFLYKGCQYFVLNSVTDITLPDTSAHSDMNYSGHKIVS